VRSFKLHSAGRSRLFPVFGLLLAYLGRVPILAGQSTSGTHMGLSAGMEFHGHWSGSTFGPTAAISLSTHLTPRLDVQGVLAGSAPIGTSGVDYPACAFPGCVAQPKGPAAAWGGTAEIVFYEHAGQSGAYVLGGGGFIRYTGHDLPGAPTRAQIDMGVGAAMGHARSQVFLEARLSFVPAADAYPRWLAPVRVGWRTRI
jgi:hypothetical protein